MGARAGVAAAVDPGAGALGLSVWVRLLKTHNLILREARRSVGARLTLPQFDVMAQLSRAPQGMTFVELSRRLLVSAGNLTGIVDRLAREGLVARETHESDRRAARLRLTPAGRRLIASSMQRHARDIESLLSEVPRGELQQLRHLLGRLAERIDADVPARRRSQGGPR
jgi:DNA-binding MarR family transcriptional regulator